MGHREYEVTTTEHQRADGPKWTAQVDVAHTLCVGSGDTERAAIDSLITTLARWAEPAIRADKKRLDAQDAAVIAAAKVRGDID